jgi:hypothetical protein
MTRAEMLAELREVLNDSTANGVWGDTRLLAYLAEGQDKFCEDTGFFVDDTNLTITLVSGTHSYAVPTRVIEIIDLWSGTRRLSKIQTGDSYISDEEIVVTAGTPQWWQTDQRTGYVRVWPTPTAAEAGTVITVQAHRYSLYDLAGDGATPGVAAAPELPVRLQRACIEWAAYKAFNHHDMEAQDPVKAADHLRMYRSYVTDGRALFRRGHGIEARVGFDSVYRV